MLWAADPNSSCWCWCSLIVMVTLSWSGLQTTCCLWTADPEMPWMVAVGLAATAAVRQLTLISEEAASGPRAGQPQDSRSHRSSSRT